MKQKDKKQGCITEMCPVVWMNFYGRHFFFAHRRQETWCQDVQQMMIHEMARPEGMDSDEIKIKLEKGTYKEEFLRFEALPSLTTNINVVWEVMLLCWWICTKVSGVSAIQIFSLKMNYWRWSQYVPLQHWYLSTRIDGVLPKVQ